MGTCQCVVFGFCCRAPDQTETVLDKWASSAHPMHRDKHPTSRHMTPDCTIPLGEGQVSERMETLLASKLAQAGGMFKQLRSCSLYFGIKSPTLNSNFPDVAHSQISVEVNDVAKRNYVQRRRGVVPTEPSVIILFFCLLKPLKVHTARGTSINGSHIDKNKISITLLLELTFKAP